MEVVMSDNRKDFLNWIRNVINPQSKSNGNSVSLDDFSSDGMSEFFYPKRFFVNNDEYSWDISTAHTKGRHLTTHYELWFSGKAFNGNMRISTGLLTLSKLKKGLRIIYEYYNLADKKEE